MMLLAGASQARACMIPVFRYALERWPPDVYGILVFHRGPLSAADLKVVEWMKQTANSEESVANCEIHLVDLSGKLDREMQAIWRALYPSAATQPTTRPAPPAAQPGPAPGQPAAQPTTRPAEPPKLPWMVVLYPYTSRVPQGWPAWTGPLSMAAARKVLDSPKRQEVAKRLVSGDSAVWVLLESGKAKADEAAAKLLGGVLKKMEATLELPNPQLWDEDLAEEEAPAEGDQGVAKRDDAKQADSRLRATFSIVRVSRTDPAEKILVKMLTRTEPDLETKYASDVMAFPVFGRGRALFALVGRGINEENIQEACGFLVGPCSCQVKQWNPGVDMLMAVDWDAALEAALGEEPVVEQPVPSLPGSIAAAVGMAEKDPPAKAGLPGGEASPKPGGPASQPAGPADLKASAAPEAPLAVKGGMIWAVVLATVAALALAATLLALWTKKRAPRL